jgi:hypothetical protein
LSRSCQHQSRTGQNACCYVSLYFHNVVCGYYGCYVLGDYCLGTCEQRRVPTSRRLMKCFFICYVIFIAETGLFVTQTIGLLEHTTLV